MLLDPADQSQTSISLLSQSLFETLWIQQPITKHNAWPVYKALSLDAIYVVMSVRLCPWNTGLQVHQG